MTSSSPPQASSAALRRGHRLFPHSMRGRLTVLFSVVFGAALAITSFVCFKVFTRAHLADFDDFLHNHTVDVADNIDPSHPPHALEDPPREWKKHRLFAVSETYAQLSDAQGNILARSSNLTGTQRLPLRPGDFRAALEAPVTYRTTDNIHPTDRPPHRRYRLISYLIQGHDGALLLQVAAPLTLLERDNHGFLWLLFILIPTSVLCSGVLGYTVSHRAFVPVARMTQQTAQIEMKNLHERIEVKESDAELRELGRTLNLLLERVETSIAAQERFIADASHQLKTPLAIVRGELELLQARLDHPEEVNEALRNTSQEVTKLINLVENLLLLARMDAGLGMISFHPVRLDELVSEAVARLRYIARGRAIRLTCELAPLPTQPEGTIDFELQGDGDLIRCLMENLIENAIKYSDDGGHVAVRLSETSSSFLLEVKDQGRGISAREMEVLFDRFWRDPQKALAVPGSGLGLAIVKKITELHRGEIRVESQMGEGSIFRVELKKV